MYRALRSPLTHLAMLLFFCMACAGAAVAQEADGPPINLGENAAWERTTWSGSGDFGRDQEGGREGGVALRISSNDGGDLSWSVDVNVDPNSVYRLSGYVRTQGVDAGSGRGAQFNIHGIDSARTRAVTGNSDWTEVSTVFRVGSQTSVQVNCLFGGWGQSTGTAWFDGVKLQKIALANASPAVSIELDQTGPQMSELIYGQFIEHLGRCIYGGIWAEMLEDRKFYFPITDDYRPYTSNALFPVVGRSPWEIVGPAAGVTMVEEDSFVGDHTPRVAAGAAIRQHDLGVVRGKQYEGYIWLKRAEGSPSVSVSLDPAGQAVRINNLGGEYTKHAFSFTASESTDEATLTVAVEGGDVMVGTLSLMPADNVEGLRADTLALLRQLKSPIYRWPGGNFVSGYDWRDGIGDRDRRPPRTNPAWTGVEHNDFGTHEFIRLCELLETEPLITINMGFEGAFSAEAQMEYVNGGADTPWGAQRAANGTEAPFGVKYWCIGNEMWGNWQLGFMSAQDYQIKHNWVVDRLQKRFDFIGIASGDAGPWSRGLLENSADNMDLIAEHFYCQRRDDVTAHVAQMTNNIRSKADFHRQTQAQLPNLGDRRVPIAMTEWNYWYGPHPYGELGTVYYLRDALGIAAGLNEYSRSTDIIGAAFYAQTVNVIGCIKTTKTDAFLAATAIPLIMYREHFGTIPVRVEQEQAEFLGVDLAAAYTADREALTLAVVNTRAETTSIDLKWVGELSAGEATVYRFGGDDPELINDPDNQPIRVQQIDGVTVGDAIEVPGYSVSIYHIPLR